MQKAITFVRSIQTGMHGKRLGASASNSAEIEALQELGETRSACRCSGRCW
jgi:hypothetical protein